MRGVPLAEKEEGRHRRKPTTPFQRQTSSDNEFIDQATLDKSAREAQAIQHCFRLSGLCGVRRPRRDFEQSLGLSLREPLRRQSGERLLVRSFAPLGIRRAWFPGYRLG